MLAKQLYVTQDAVNNWQYHKNSPADLDTIKNAAAFLHVDWELLVKRSDGGNVMTQLTERQKDAAKRIYDIMIWFLEEFRNSDGFNDWWSEFTDQGCKHPEDAIYERIMQMEERIHLVLNQEYFDLHDHEIYDAFCEFACEDLVDVYNGKVSLICSQSHLSTGTATAYSTPRTSLSPSPCRRGRSMRSKTQYRRRTIPMTYQDLVNEFRTLPREIPTAPINGAAPKWFTVYAEQDAVYVTSGREHAPACRICPDRRLKPAEFSIMLELYRRRKNGEPVSREASAQSINQSYWFGIFQALAL